MRELQNLPFFRLWLAGTLVFLMGTAFVYRPDRDAAQYWQHRSVIAERLDVEDRQLLARIRLLQNEGFDDRQIEIELLGGGTFSSSNLREKIKLSAALQTGERARQRLSLFCLTSVLPPLTALELGLLLLLIRRGPKARWSLRRKRSHG